MNKKILITILLSLSTAIASADTIRTSFAKANLDNLIKSAENKVNKKEVLTELYSSPDYAYLAFEEPNSVYWKHLISTDHIKVYGLAHPGLDNYQIKFDTPERIFDDYTPKVVDFKTTSIEDKSEVIAKCTFDNNTDTNQTFTCGGYDLEVSSSTTTSTTNSCKAGLGYEAGGSAGVPFVAEGEVKATANVELDASSSNSKTHSYTQTYHLGSTDMLVPPHKRGTMVMNFKKISGIASMEYPVLSMSNISPDENAPVIQLMLTLDQYNNSASLDNYYKLIKQAELFKVDDSIATAPELEFDDDTQTIKLKAKAEAKIDVGTEATVVMQTTPLDSSANDSRPKYKFIKTVKPTISDEKTYEVKNEGLKDASSFEDCARIFYNWDH